MTQNDKLFTAILGLWSAFMAFIAPIGMLLTLICVVIVFDLVTGYISSVMKSKIKSVFGALRHFNSYKGTKSIVKMMFYLIFTIVVYIAESALIGFDSIYMTKFSTFMIVFVELKSICENLDIITGRDVFTSIFVKLRKAFENKVTNQITDTDAKKKEGEGA